MPVYEKTAAQHLVDALIVHGADRVFCVPGESYLSVLDALHDHPEAIETVTCRHEGAAAMMADADGKLTGRPGICMVTRGPGATNASSGVHVAFQDSTPMILFIGQIDRSFAEREAFQEIDYRRMFGQMAKWVAEIDRPERMHEFVARAFAVATSGRPGPVVLALPEDMLVEQVSLPAPVRYHRVETHPAPSQMLAVREALDAAQRPLLIVGGSQWTPEAYAAVERFATANDLPVVASFRRQDRFDNAHHCYAGEIGLGVNPKLRARVDQADLLMVLGGRLGEVQTGGYEMLAIPRPEQQMIHIHADAGELGRVYTPSMAINATPRAFAAMLDQLAPINPSRWSAWRETARADYEGWQVTKPVPGRFNLGEAVSWMRDALPDDTVFCNGAGNFATWLHRFHCYRRLGTQLAPTSGSMGYGVPAAIAAKLRHRDRTVVCLAGDGDFQMTGQELATAAQYGLGVLVIVVDNGMLGTIRMHQERHYPGRVSATDLHNPDFAALAKAYGAYSEYVEDTANFGAAVERALASGKPALIHVRTDREALTINQSLTQIRETALAR